jgi:hypothetical protein
MKATRICQMHLPSQNVFSVEPVATSGVCCTYLPT